MNPKILFISNPAESGFTRFEGCMDYESLLSSLDQEPEQLFRTARGSTYAHLADGTTVRNRSGLNHSDTTTGFQPASTKTLYLDPKATNAVASWIQDPSTSTRLIPEMKDGKFTGHALVQMAEDHYVPASKYGPEISKKAGDVVSRVPVSLKPELGLHPVEIYGSPESPKGSKAGNIHFGNAITEVLPKGGSPSRALPIPIGGGGYRPGQDTLQHSLNPLKLAEGGGVKMPSEYSQGGWKLI
jgi:hypothetical protein